MTLVSTGTPASVTVTVADGPGPKSSGELGWAYEGEAM